MIHYSAAELSVKQHYKFLTGSVIPRPIAWVTTLDEENQVVNLAPFSYFNIAAKEIPLVSLSINTRAGQRKDTAKNLLMTKNGVIHIVDDSLTVKMNQTAVDLPYEKSETDFVELTLIDSHSVKAPAIKEALIRLEVKLYQHLPLKNPAGELISDFFLLEVLDYYFDPLVFDEATEYILPEKLNPIARLAGNTYAHIEDLFELKRPLPENLSEKN